MDTNKISGGTASVLSGIGSGKAREEAMDYTDFTDGEGRGAGSESELRSRSSNLFF